MRFVFKMIVFPFWLLTAFLALMLKWTLNLSAFVLAIVVLGGMGSQFAVILAAILLVVSRELMRDFNEYSMLMLGGLMVLMMIWRPQGLLPMTRPQLKLKNGAAKGEQA
jgi:branched-chain amino acid transport system permease protein